MIINYIPKAYILSEVQPIIPEDEYNARITNITDFVSKEEERFLRICFTILDGVYANTNINTSIAIESQDEKKLEKHKRKLDGICAALNLKRIGDTDEILGAVLRINVRIFPTESGEKKNYVASFLPKTTEIFSDVKPNSESDIPF